ncbi:MAG: ribosome silencing factor [Bacillota bacterium]|nr:ribosome silencing factor [Bacillota bacterium]
MELSTQELTKEIVNILDSKKAEDIEVLRIGDISILADYFILCTGSSSTHVKALADEVEYKLSEMGIEPHHIEGYRGANWILMDYSGVVVHILYKEAREFYKIERLWADAENIDVSSLLG